MGWCRVLAPVMFPVGSVAAWVDTGIAECRYWDRLLTEFDIGVCRVVLQLRGDSDAWCCLRLICEKGRRPNKVDFGSGQSLTTRAPVQKPGSCNPYWLVRAVLGVVPELDPEMALGVAACCTPVERLVRLRPLSDVDNWQTHDHYWGNRHSLPNGPLRLKGLALSRPKR
jgi:hypothetical protein